MFSLRSTVRAGLATGVLAALPLPAAETVWPAPQWPTATPAEMGMDQAELEQARDYALTGDGSGIITRGGRVVLSWGDPTTIYELKSTAKSIGVTALGIALKDGRVGLDDRAQLHLSEFGLPPAANGDTGWLDDVTLLQLATHTAGFDFTAEYGYLDLAPGSVWAYSDGGTNWLADVLTVAFGRDLRAVLFGRVFTPLGITPADLFWRDSAYRGDTIHGFKRRELASGIDADVDAMARIGYLYLRRGMWNGQRILDESFVAAVSQPVPQVTPLPVGNPAAYFDAARHYGLLWWNNADGTIPNVPRDAYWSWGLYESLIVVIPSLDIVAVRAGWGWRSSWDADYSVLEPFIGPIVSSTSCAANGPGTGDGDGDGVSGVCDCDDTSAETHPGAPEVNDGTDNHCFGDAGFGIADEISGVTGFLTAGDRHRCSWPPQSGATRYEVRRSTSARFDAGCTSVSTTSAETTDPAIPPAGSVFYYVVRALEPNPGSWGVGQAGAERTLESCQAS